MRWFAIALASFAAASISVAQDGQWTLVQTIGDVTVEEPGLSKIAVKPNAKLNEGATLTTGATGRAILTDGRSSITVDANSRIELPSANDENITSIRQDFGKALFKVQKKPTAHFEVQTPYLAAVVKGTTFEVTVDAMGASVDVEEGLVDVGANASGERTLVPGGKRTRVLSSGHFEGGRPAEINSNRQTIAALGVIDVEIAPEQDRPQNTDREFAALQPAFQRDARTEASAPDPSDAVGQNLHDDSSDSSWTRVQAEQEISERTQPDKLGTSPSFSDTNNDSANNNGGNDENEESGENDEDEDNNGSNGNTGNNGNAGNNGNNSSNGNGAGESASNQREPNSRWSRQERLALLEKLLKAYKEWKATRNN